MRIGGRRRKQRLTWIIGAAIVAAIAITAALVLVLTRPPAPAPWPGALTEVAYAREGGVGGAMPDPVVEQDPERLADLTTVLHKHGWGPGWKQQPGSDCTDAFSYVLELTFDDGSADQVRLEMPCEERDPFTRDVESLLNRWG